MKWCSLTQTLACTLLDEDAWVCRDLLLALLLIAPTLLPTEPPWRGWAGRTGWGEKKRRGVAASQSAICSDSWPCSTPPHPNTTTTQSPTLLPSLHITTSPAFFRLAEGWFLYSTVKIKPGVCVCCDFHRTRDRPPYCIRTVCNHKWCTRASAWLLEKPNCETYQSTVCKKTTKKTGKYLKQSHVLYTARLFMCAVCVRWVDKGWLTQHSHSVWIGAPSELKDGRKKITVATKDTAKRNGEKERRR